ncbi:reverse transcriptase domain-containing protein [Tanacetum coccineum]
MLKSLLSYKEKLIELANTPLSENCSAVILKKLPEKLDDPGKFLIPCGFSELKCKALADLGASINLIPLSVWKKLGLPELISTQMTLKLANQDICTPKGIARDVFVLVGKFTFPADFVIVDYESDPRVPPILGRPFLQTARALIGVYEEEMILHDGDERLTLNMRNDTSSYSNESHKESINMIDIYNVLSEEYLEDLFSTHLSGNPTFSSHTDLTSPEVIDPESGNPTLILEPVTKSSSSPTLISLEECELIWEEFEAYLASDSFPSRNDDLVKTIPEEFADELAFSESFPPGNDDMTPCSSMNRLLIIHPHHYGMMIIFLILNPLKKITNASLILEDFNPPLYELPFHKEVPGLGILLLFSSENEEKVFNPGILTSKRVHTSLLPELFHQDPKVFKVINIFENPMEIFPCSYEEDIRILDVLCLHFYPP